MVIVVTCNKKKNHDEQDHNIMKIKMAMVASYWLQQEEYHKDHNN
jgi:hypothetical protein